MIKYIIGTGWWCDGTGKHEGSMQAHIKSTDFIRKKEFFKIWYYFVNKYTNPEKIIITDSASPVKPDLPEDTRIEIISLRENFGHSANSHRRKIMCGASRAVLNGALYAYLNDVDYFIYIEQDCLVKGDMWLEIALDHMKKGKIMYGDGKGTPQLMQMSLMIIEKNFIPQFIYRFINSWELTLKLFKGESMPELLNKLIRYWHITDKLFGIFCDDNRHTIEARMHRTFKNDVDFLPFGHGRARPIDFEDQYLYAQYWTEEDLTEFLMREGVINLLDNR